MCSLSIIVAVVVSLWCIPGPSLGVWVCKNSTSVSGPQNPIQEQEPETPKSPRKGYHCGVEYETLILGVFFNRGADDIEKLLRSSSYGVQLLEPHELDYELLSKTWASNQKFPWKFEARNSTEDIKNIIAGHGNLSIAYQLNSTCDYFDEFSSKEIERAVRIYSEPILISSTLGWKCEDSVSKDVGRLTSTFGDIHQKGNFGAKPVNLKIEYGESFSDATSPTAFYYVKDYYGESEAKELIEEINRAISQIPSPSPFTGLSNLWENFKIKGLTSEDKEFTLSVPPGKAARAYRANAQCGPMEIWGPAFPVYLPPPDKEGPGPCESPNLQPCVTLDVWTVRTPYTSLLGTVGKSPPPSCTEHVMDVQVPNGATEIQLKYGLEGPWADKVSEDFKRAFQQLLHDTWPSSGKNPFHPWKTYDVKDWSPYPTSKTVLLRNGAGKVVQAKAKCGPLYSYYVDDVQYQ